MTASIKTHRLDGKSSSLVFASEGNTLDLIYLGPRLPDCEELAALAAISNFGRHENQPDDPVHGGLLPETKNGYPGRPAVQLRRTARIIDTDFELLDVTCTAEKLVATWKDRVSKLMVAANWEVRTNDIFSCHYCFTNEDSEEIILEVAPSLVLPLPSHFTSVTSFPGRWSREMQVTKHRLGQGAIEMRSSGGKPGFDPGNWLVLHNSNDNSVIGCHLAWNGDHATYGARDRDGRTLVLMGSVLDHQAATLQPDCTICSATSFVSFACHKDQLSHNYHQFVRNEILPQRAQWGPRKVHLNSWEALGFNLSQEALIDLADQAAALGAERFVLDDGWFKGRRSDRSGLGDWIADPVLFPQGLGPLIDHVRRHDMDFGLWIEPEMISADSDLYRAHPDWCVHNNTSQRPSERNQLVLDLSRRDVMHYLATSISNLLENNDIAYLKWDHNRRLFPAGTAQTEGFIALLTAIADAHPHIEIENCASGGGRIDLRSLAMAHRIWPSDNNDPVERLRINRSWTTFLPLEILGNHVGPSPNPVTGRRTDMDFRAKIALFGHMGVEAKPADMTQDEQSVLAAHIALYKKWRDILHTGRLWQLTHDDDGTYGQIIVSNDKAIAFAAQTQFAENFNVAAVRLKGLEANAFYRVELPQPWPSKASQYLADSSVWNGTLVLSGAALMEKGLALPLTHPETAWIITLEKRAGR